MEIVAKELPNQGEMESKENKDIHHSRSWKLDENNRTIESATDMESGQVEFERLTWLDTKEAATYLRKTANALQIMVYRGYIRPRKFRRRLFFRKVELDRLLESSTY